MRRGADIFEITDEPLVFDPAGPTAGEQAEPNHGEDSRAATFPMRFGRTVSGACLLLAVAAVAWVIARSPDGGEGPLSKSDGAGTAERPEIARRSHSAAHPSRAPRTVRSRSDERRQSARGRALGAVAAPPNGGEATPVTQAPARVIVVLRAETQAVARDPRTPALSEAEREFGFER
jgi:hypothetical protein